MTDALTIGTTVLALAASAAVAQGNSPIKSVKWADARHIEISADPQVGANGAREYLLVAGCSNCGDASNQKIPITSRATVAVVFPEPVSGGPYYIRIKVTPSWARDPIDVDYSCYYDHPVKKTTCEKTTKNSQF